MADFVLARTPMYDGVRNMARAWVLYFANQVGQPPIVIDVTLTAASTTINPPSTGSAVDLVVILRQDATGGRAVVWGTGIAAASTSIVTTASTISTFRFVYSTAGNQWVMIGQPTTGMTP